MAERPDISEIFRRTMETNIGFYAGLVDLSANYLKNLSTIFSEVPVKAGTDTEQPVQPETGTNALVLEAEAGETAQAFFLVDNKLSRKVPARVIASPVVDANGEQVEQELTFEPSELTLEPGEKMLVQVATEISYSLDPGVAYQGSISIPGLADTPAPVVVRRRGEEEDTDMAIASEPAKTGQRKRSTGVKKSTRARKKQA